MLHINARFLTQPASGTQRFAEELLTALDARLAASGRGPRMIAWVPPGEHRAVNWQRIELRETGRMGGHMWEQTALAWAARDGWLLNLVSSAPLSHPRQLVTFHDAAIFTRPENFSRQYGAFHRALRPRLAARAHTILTVSEFSRGELAREMGIDPARFAVIPNGCDHIHRLRPDASVLVDNGLARGGFVLFVGNRAPHKNFGTALEAFRRLNRPGLRLVTVGIGRRDIFGDEGFGDETGVLHLARIDDAQLAALYDAAALLLFPSRYEGFGIPPLEAMSLGCPVVASTAAAIPETVGQAALTAYPDDVGAFSAAMARILDEPGLAALLQAAGRARAAQFRWDHAAARLEDVLVRAMSPARVPGAALELAA